MHYKNKVAQYIDKLILYSDLRLVGILAGVIIMRALPFELCMPDVIAIAKQSCN